MITKYKNSIITSVIIALAIVTTSCNLGDQEDFTDASTLKATSPDIIIDGNWEEGSGIEQDKTINFTLKLTEPQIVDIHVPVFSSGGTATEGEDYLINTPTVIIPAYSLSASGSISIIADAEPEDQETFSITVGDNTVANTLFQPKTYDFVLDNYVSESIEITFDWGTELIYADDDPYSSCDFIDLDIFVSDAAGFDIDDPWATFNGTGYAATGDCPEVLVMDKADWGDGEYIIWHELYANQYYFLWDEKTVPIKTTVVRAGSFSSTFIQDDSQTILSTDPGGEEGGTKIHGYIAKVTIAGDTYTITAENGDEIGSGKMTNSKKTPRPYLQLDKSSSKATIILNN
jgi:hypothetical protein